MAKTKIPEAELQALANTITPEDATKIADNIQKIPGATTLNEITVDQVCGGTNVGEVLKQHGKEIGAGLGAIGAVITAAFVGNKAGYKKGWVDGHGRGYKLGKAIAQDEFVEADKEYKDVSDDQFVNDLFKGVDDD